MYVYIYIYIYIYKITGIMSLACFFCTSLVKNTPIVIGRVNKNEIHDRDRVSQFLVLFMK